MLQNFSTRNWDENFTELAQQQAINCLENGQILFFPELCFKLSPEEHQFLSPEYADPHAKNISYLATQNKLWGVQHLTDEQHLKLKNMLDRFSQYACQFIKQILPLYTEHLMIGRTSFRPVEISGRVTSYRKDDKRLHIDAFPSAPNQGKRILRVFANINPNNEQRLWRLGEPFEKVAKKFLPSVKKPVLGSAAALRLLRITKSYRTLYDHYMLNIHDSMKKDEQYQRDCMQKEIFFPAGSTWIVQTDHVSHAAMQGQFALEQTIYLPIEAMQDQSCSPLRILERMLQQRLV